MLAPRLAVGLTVATLGGVAAPTAAGATNVCRSHAGSFELRASSVGCVAARSVQYSYTHSENPNGCAGPCMVYAADRTWRCSVRILRNYGYDPAIFGDRVTGRVLCIHIANRGRFVRWKFDGGGD